MVKKIIALCLCMVLLTGCAPNDPVVLDRKGEQSMFTVVEQTAQWSVVYHRGTMVMYAVSNGGSNEGTFTLLVDSLGNPLLYDGE